MGTRDLSELALPVTLRALARLLDYPDATLRAHLPEVREALHAHSALGATRLAEIDALIDTLISRPGLESEAAYVDLFDRGRGTALHLFEHVHGDSRDRGPAMIDLIKTYEQGGLLLASNELPDHLTVLLEYASTQPRQSAIGLLGEIAHILQAIFSALERRESRRDGACEGTYASVLGALLDLAGEPAQAVPVPAEPALDETWREPASFGGCPSDAGQAARQAGEPQPIRIVRGPRPSNCPPSSHGASV